MATPLGRSGRRALALTLLLACGAVGPLLFIAVFLIAGATRPNYSPWRHYVSSLSTGEQGWVQVASFIVSGALVLASALGLKRALGPGKGATWGPILLGIFGLSFIGCGIFVADPILGYPPGAPGTPTLHGALHSFFAATLFGSLIAACFALMRRFGGNAVWRGWAPAHWRPASSPRHSLSPRSSRRLPSRATRPASCNGYRSP